jgi:small basic protein
MILILFVLIGAAVGLYSPVHIGAQYSQYAAIVILASADSVFGGASAMVRKCFDMKIFLSGFLGNVILAAALTFIGKALDADLYFVGMLVFGTRLFNNFSIIRRAYIDKFSKKIKKI